MMKCMLHCFVCVQRSRHIDARSDAFAAPLISVPTHAVKRGGKVFCPEASCSGGAALPHTEIARRVDGDESPAQPPPRSCLLRVDTRRPLALRLLQAPAALLMG